MPLKQMLTLKPLLTGLVTALALAGLYWLAFGYSGRFSVVMGSGLALSGGLSALILTATRHTERGRQDG